jgi:recombination protein RecR
MSKDNPFEILITQLIKLPGIGRKAAQRIAFFLMNQSRLDAVALAKAIVDVKDKLKPCSRCFNLSEQDPCKICADGKRLEGVLCIVEEPEDIVIIEQNNIYRGLYHVLGGRYSPLEDISEDQLTIKKLHERIFEEDIKEIILATSPNVDGDATALLVAERLSDTNVKITRLGRGVPVGGDLIFLDKVTLEAAFKNRENLNIKE